MATGSWIAKAHWCAWGSKAGPCSSNQQKNCCSSNCLKKLILILSKHSASQFVVYAAVWPQTSQGVYADPSPQPKVHTIGTWASELDHRSNGRRWSGLMSSRRVWGAQRRVWSVDLACRSQSTRTSVRCEKQVFSLKAPPHNLGDLKDLLLMTWCQIPQHNFRGLVEIMPQKVLVGGHNVMAD